MKIAHVLPSLARGGGERLTIELANRQVEAGHDVTLIIGSFLPVEMTHGELDVAEAAVTSDQREATVLPLVHQGETGSVAGAVFDRMLHSPPFFI